MVKVSVIIPIYNAEKYLEKCLSSVASQTLEDDIEIICVDDGSTDKSWDIVQQLAGQDKRIIAVQQENSGAAVARNKALELASGEYIGFVDSDDYIDNSYFEELYRAAKKASADIARAYVKVDSGREDSAVNRFNLSHEAYERQYNVHIKDMIAKNKLNQRFSIWLAIFKRDMLTHNEIFFPPEIRTGQDILFNIKTGYFANKIVYVDKPVYYYRLMRDGSLMTQMAYTATGLRSRLLVIEENLKFLNATPDYDKDIYISHVFDSFNFVHTKLSTIEDKEFAREVAKKISKMWQTVKYKKELQLLIAQDYQEFSKIVDNSDEIFEYIHNVSAALGGIGVSVVVPAHNASAHIAEVIDRLRGQIFKRFECIIVDDGSTDDTVAVVEEKIRGDERFRLLKQKNQGVSVARNRGLSEAVGEYVIFLDADDIYEAELLNELYRASKNNQIDVAICGYNVLDNSDGSIGRDIKTPLVAKLPEGVFSSSDVDFIFNFGVLTVWTKMFRREFINENDLIFNKDIRRSQDLLFVGSALALAERIMYVDKPLITYRSDNENSNMGQAAKYPMSFIDSLDLLSDFLAENKLLKKLAKSYDNLLVGSCMSYLELYEDSKSVMDMVFKEVSERFNVRGLPKRSKDYFFMSDKYETILAIASGEVVEYLSARLAWQKDYSAQLTRRLNATEERRASELESTQAEMHRIHHWAHNMSIKDSLRSLHKGVRRKVKRIIKK